MADSLRGIAGRARRAVRLGLGQGGNTMSALRRLKAYFGMVPAEEFEAAAFGAAGYGATEYPAEYNAGEYGPAEYEAVQYQAAQYQAECDEYHPPFPDSRHGSSHGQQSRRTGYEHHQAIRRPPRAGITDYDSGFSTPTAHHAASRMHPARSPSCSADPRVLIPPTAASVESRTGEFRSADPEVRGSLAIDTATSEAARVDGRSTVRQRLASQPFTHPARTDSFTHDDLHPLARIVTLHPHSYNEARPIGERYREGNPVIMNLTAMEDRDAKRLVDFAAGLAFALRGSIDKVTTKVFLLSPPDIEVSAEDRRRIAEGRLFD
jgi:cell division inhibitor SepF